MLKKIETVLIGTSLTEASDEVVRAGLKVARAAKARVVLVHAYSPRAAYGGAPFIPEVAMDGVLEQERRALRRDMESQAQRLGIRIEELAATILGPGPAHQMIIETAHKASAQLIVVGPSEVPRIAKLFGSTADRVVRRATCPVLVVRRDLPIPPARVLLPVDLSILSAEAFHEGLDFLGLVARDRGSAATLPELQALYVITELDRRLFAPEEAPERVEHDAKDELIRFVGRHSVDSPFWIVSTIASGYVEEEILARVHEWEPDLVVLGTHGRSGFERFLLGSVATRVIRDGGSNLLVVPPEAAKQQAEAVREANLEVLTA